MTSPPAQYKAEGSGGVINIVTRKHRAQDFSGDLRAAAAAPAKSKAAGFDYGDEPRLG